MASTHPLERRLDQLQLLHVSRGDDFLQCLNESLEQLRHWLPSDAGEKVLGGRWAEFLASTLETLPAEDPTFAPLLRRLHQLADYSPTLPAACCLPADGAFFPVEDGVRRRGFAVFARGHLGVRSGDGPELICKSLAYLRKKSTEDHDEATRRLYAQVVLGRYLRHPNVARCPGAIVHLSTYQPRWPEPQMPGVPSMATECAQYGSLLSFVKANPNCDLVSLLYNAARGLAYVHSLGFYHSDVKQDNVVVSAEGVPQWIDFYYAGVIDPGVHAEHIGWTWAYTAPERVTPKVNGDVFPLKEEDPWPGTISRPGTQPADVFAFGVLMNVVFAGEENPTQMGQGTCYSMSIVEGRRLPRVPHPACTNAVWALIERCWDERPENRPSMREVVLALGGSSA